MITAYMTVDPATQKLEVYRVGFDTMPTNRRWEAVKFEVEKPCDGGEALVWYIARTKAMAERIAPGRAVFTGDELRNNEAFLRSTDDSGVASWLRWVCMMKCLLGGGPVETITYDQPRPLPAPGESMMIRARFIGHDGAEVDLSPGPLETPAAAAPPPLPEGM